MVLMTMYPGFLWHTWRSVMAHSSAPLINKRGIFMQKALSQNHKIQRETPFNFDQRATLRRAASVLMLVLVLAIWYLITAMKWVEPWLVPTPQAVADKFKIVIENGVLWKHTYTTLQAVLIGLTSGVIIGTMLGYAIAHSKLLEDLLSPIIVAFQSTPIVAYAPLLVIWLGSGIESKVVTCALIVFFPMLMNTVVGIRNVPRELYDLMHVSQATRWQTFTKLEVPAALPILLTGLKTSATLAVIGAVVGEFIAAKAGLGVLINTARTSFDTPLVFVAVIALAIMAGTLYTLVSLLEKRVLSWQRRGSSRR